MSKQDYPLSKNLRKLREQKGLSQDRLAKFADVANNTIIKYDSNSRRVLARSNQEIKEKNINYPKEDNNVVQSSPILLAFNISTAADNHLKFLLDADKKLGINISSEKTKKLYAELLSSHYFFITFFLNKYVQGNQFILFVLRTHIALLDIIQKNGVGSWMLNFNPFTKQKRTEEIEKSVSEAIQENEDFYIRNKLNKKEKREISDDIKLFDIKEDVYESNVATQLIVKSNYRISNILSIRENPTQYIPLFGANMSMVETSIEIAKKLRPVWHLPEDKNVINDYKMENQEQTL